MDMEEKKIEVVAAVPTIERLRRMTNRNHELAERKKACAEVRRKEARTTRMVEERKYLEVTTLSGLIKVVNDKFRTKAFQILELNWKTETKLEHLKDKKLGILSKHYQEKQLKGKVSSSLYQKKEVIVCSQIEDMSEKDRRRLDDRLKILDEQKEILFLQIKHLQTEEDPLQSKADEYIGKAEEARSSGTDQKKNRIIFLVL